MGETSCHLQTNIYSAGKASLVHINFQYYHSGSNSLMAALDGCTDNQDKSKICFETFPLV